MANAPSSSLPSPLDSDQYLASPISTIVRSIDDPQSEIIRLHDLADAYSTLSRRIRLLAPTIIAGTQIYAAFTPFTSHNASFCLCLIRDIGRCLLNPFSIFSQESVPDGLALEESTERAQAYATLSHHALVFLSDVFSLVPIMNKFLDDQLKDLLRELLSILSTPHLPTPSSKKSWDLATWVLVSQRLRPDILLSQKQKLKNVLDRLLRGDFDGSLHRSQGLKVFSTLLRPDIPEFMEPLLPLYPTILVLTTDDALDVQIQALKTLCCISSLKLHTPDTPWSQKIASHTHKFIKFEMGKSKASQNGSFQHILSSAMQGSEERWKVKGPLWASLMVACLICLSDAELFTHPYSLKLFLNLLGRATNHKRTYVRALHPHIWICLVWCYSRLVDSARHYQAIKNTLDTTKRALLVLRQELKGGIATALIASQLLDVSCTSEEIDIVLGIVKDLLSSSKESQIREAINILSRLVCDVGSPSSGDSRIGTRNFSEIVLRDLFVAPLMDLSEEQIRRLVSRLPNADLAFIRPFTEAQIRKHWEEFLQLWVYSVNRTHKSSTDYKYYEAQLLSIWQSLLLVQSQLEPATALLSILPPAADCITTTITSFIGRTDSSSNQIRHLKFVYELWRVTKQSYGTQYLVSLAEAILFAVLEQKYDLDGEGIKQAWSLLFVDLVSIGTPNFLPSVLARTESQEGVEVQRQLWVMMAKNDLIKAKGSDWEEILLFLVIPFQSWNLNTQEVHLWTNLFSIADQAARTSPATEVEFVNSLLKKLGSQKIKSLQSCPGVIPALLTSLRFFADKVLHSDLLSSVNTFLVNIYPPSPENHILALQIFGGVAHLVATCNEKNILQLLVLLKDSLSLWFKDAAKSLLQQEHNILIDNIYRVSLDILSKLPPAIEIIQALSAYLASSFERMGYPPIGPLAFEKFWRKSYHEQPESFKRLIPEDLKTCLKAWSDHCGDSLAEGLPDDSQSTGRSIVSDSESPNKVTVLSGDCDRSRGIEMGSDDSYHFIPSNSSSEDVQRTPTPGNPRSSTPKPRSEAFLPGQADISLFSGALRDVSLNLTGSRENKRPIAESTPNVLKRRRTETAVTPSNDPFVFQDQRLRMSNTSSALDVSESPGALPRSSASIEIQNSSPSLSRYRSNRMFVPASPEAYDSALQASSPALFVARKTEAIKQTMRTVDDDAGGVVEDSTEMERLPYPLNQDRNLQTSHSPDSLVSRPSANKRLQSEPAYESGFPSRPTPLRRSHTTSERLDALERAYTAVAESQGVSQVPIEELAHAASLAHRIGAKITEHLNRKLRNT
ncbi:hypothetical protein AGABI2DRAFT_119245 [Agaricus bisporus var. bisporus H97]|uniref:hypothetical protein n=1 Tax=Agaricus bisporus var. bisporus (strain H97 / ATCC MYA-4626 / FGSC 10389) TaxID=936046 RepID=UPI00029F78D3|nr:hypothetical protein AGABI2DRAFT_119245 [Agaricus bisporus var. bisporus H97]EKV45563.1 hypothetical protein AGABI2DRAFT_119245 [Agaricus bisporus var. bisporus H97]